MIADLSRKPPRGKVRLLPVPGYYIPGVPDVPLDVDPDVAAEYLSYRPPAFVAVPEPEPPTPVSKTAEE